MQKLALENSVIQLGLLLAEADDAKQLRKLFTVSLSQKMGAEALYFRWGPWPYGRRLHSLHRLLHNHPESVISSHLASPNLPIVWAWSVKSVVALACQIEEVLSVIAMVSQNTPSSSGILHHFIASDPNPNQTRLNQRLDAYISAMRCNNTFPDQSPPAGLPTIQCLETRMSEDSEISHTRHLMDLLGTTAPGSNNQQRLSLSLGSQMLLSQNNQFRQRSYNQHLVVSPQSHYSMSSEEGREGYSPGAGHTTSDHYAYSTTTTLVNTVRHSRYLKAVQSLLQEVVNINDYETGWDDYAKKLSIRGRRATRLSSELSTELCSNGFLSEEKQELHLKFAKLVSLLEEVESRYERYYHQMQEVVSSFEMIAGAGSARCYTGLALQAMSKHFFSLSDAILSQINLTKARIYKIPAQGRQAWRPIRGLPESSVVILRAWLFEHFLHPYPTESEKLILSSQTGLSKNQVSNWFINARVRLWKPMIEEMYKEELADSSDSSDPLGTIRNSRSPSRLFLSVARDNGRYSLRYARRRFSGDVASSESVSVIETVEEGVGKGSENDTLSVEVVEDEVAEVEVVDAPRAVKSKVKKTKKDDEEGEDNRFKLRNGREGDTSRLFDVEESLKELEQLADTAGLMVVGSSSQKLASPNPKTYIGSGKVAEIKTAIHALDVETLIFDDELSAGQLRNLEKALGETSEFATELLSFWIFSTNVQQLMKLHCRQTSQMEYQLPRLTKMWTHLERQSGGQVKGMGEKQIEVDKRILRTQIGALKKELETVRKHRQQYRNRRTAVPVPVVSLVGYTNAGKSTLLNQLTGADVLAEDQLFATLDPTTRRVQTKNGKEFLLTDTVGFIQKLPTTLVAAFRATLEEISESSLLVHVVDISHPLADQQIEAVEKVLSELDVASIPKLIVWNKVDKASNPEEIKLAAAKRDDVICISALTGEGLDDFCSAIQEKLKDLMVWIEALVPFDKGELLNTIHKVGMVEKTEYTENGTLIKAHVPLRFAQLLTPLRLLSKSAVPI
ncbi:unnamed protein product [Rhodiola kirilowii]